MNAGWSGCAWRAAGGGAPAPRGQGEQAEDAQPADAVAEAGIQRGCALGGHVDDHGVVGADEVVALVAEQPSLMVAGQRGALAGGADQATPFSTARNIAMRLCTSATSLQSLEGTSRMSARALPAWRTSPGKSDAACRVTDGGVGAPPPAGRAERRQHLDLILIRVLPHGLFPQDCSGGLRERPTGGDRWRPL
jgi:hypothetical protein